LRRLGGWWRGWLLLALELHRWLVKKICLETPKFMR
jgi:hypothetical protein